jgi:fucose permease
LLLGRALAPLILKRAAESLLLRCGLLLGGVGITVLLFAHAPREVLAGAALAGLGLATVFPLLVSLLARQFGAAAQRVAGVIFAAAGVGGATLPWLVGAASTHFASLKAGLTVPLVGTLTMLVLHVTTRATSMKTVTRQKS